MPVPFHAACCESFSAVIVLLGRLLYVGVRACVRVMMWRLDFGERSFSFAIHFVEISCRILKIVRKLAVSLSFRRSFWVGQTIVLGLSQSSHVVSPRHRNDACSAVRSGVVLGMVEGRDFRRSSPGHVGSGMDDVRPGECYHAECTLRVADG